MGQALALAASEEQQRTKVWRHPERDQIHALIRAGKTAAWIAAWLRHRYPTVDEHGGETAEAVRNARWQLRTETITRYRRKFMPECAPGVDLIDSDLEEMLGHRLPAPRDVGAQYELDVMETALQAAQASLARALKSDKEMEMLQGVTLDAQAALIDAAKIRLQMAQSLGVPGYPKIAEAVHQKIDQTSTSRNVNVELHGVVAKDGSVSPSEPAKVSVIKELMAMEPARAAEIVDAAQRVADADVESSAEEVTDGQ
jgi:hypothetical protein